MSIGTLKFDWTEGYVKQPATGWVWTIGLNGARTMEGEIFGQFSNLLMEFFWDYYYPGVIGFTWLKMQFGSGLTPDILSYYLGAALLVKLGSTAPDLPWV